jgi:hypothetical protein
VLCSVVATRWSAVNLIEAVRRGISGHLVAMLQTCGQFWMGEGCAHRPVCTPFGSCCVSVHYRCAALHFASENGHTESVKALLAKGADVNAKNDCGKTAFHVAKDRRAYIAAVEVRCAPLPCEAGPCSGHCHSHAPRGAAGGICSQGAAAESVVWRRRPAARSTAVAFGGRWLSRLRLFCTWCALCGTSAQLG